MQRYTIFNKRNKIFITKTSQALDNKEYQTIINCDNETFKHQKISMFFDEKNNNNILLLCDKISTEEVFRLCTREFYHVFAAGGLVENDKGEFLFMFRNGFWDLPKGHWEEGESFENTAIREVREETGIKHPRIESFLDISRHTYCMNNRYELKHTYWYKMTCSHRETLIPQTEEGINKLIWVNKDDLHIISENTYPNIKLLMEKYFSEK